MGQYLIPGLIAIAVLTVVFIVLRMLLKNRSRSEVVYGTGIGLACFIGFWFGNLLSIGACGLGRFSWLCNFVMYPISMVGSVLIFYWVTIPRSRDL